MILAQERNYKGPLGEFVYNTKDFEVLRQWGPMGMFEILKYRGHETDGDKIEIPKGIKDCSYMFEKCSLKTPPIIPIGVKNTSYMFKDCLSLTRGAVLPYGVVIASFMYAGCRQLRSVPVLPSTVRQAQYMCDTCSMLYEPPTLSENLENASGMFRGCREMVKLADVPETCTKTDHIYRNCEKLKDILGDDYEAVISDDDAFTFPVPEEDAVSDEGVVEE